MPASSRPFLPVSRRHYAARPPRLTIGAPACPISAKIAAGKENIAGSPTFLAARRRKSAAPRGHENCSRTAWAKLRAIHGPLHQPRWRYHEHRYGHFEFAIRLPALPAATPAAAAEPADGSSAPPSPSEAGWCWRRRSDAAIGRLGRFRRFDLAESGFRLEQFERDRDWEQPRSLRLIKKPSLRELTTRSRETSSSGTARMAAPDAAFALFPDPVPELRAAV